MDRIPVIIDTDPGHDDVFAIMTALASDRIDIKAITTVCGNSTVENTTRNALNVLNYFGRGDIPVAMGCSRPMMHELDRSGGIKVHGESGLDGPVFPEHNLKPVDMKAVDLIAKVLRESSEKVVIAPLGPLCNIALLMLTYPELKEKIAYITLMGGNTYNGNVTPAAEYNIYVDPESAYVVFESGVPIVMHSINSTFAAAVTFDRLEAWKHIDTRGGRLASDLIDFYVIASRKRGFDRINICDANAVAYIVDPSLYETFDTDVTVDLTGEFTRGQTVVEFRSRANGGGDLDEYYVSKLHRHFRRNCSVVVRSDADGFYKLLTESLRKLA
ncbi:MAG: nucleoside hydrolase [Oscillospiraceae bacterium]|jgi:pyrimidine-specific ribonucleoside hydrolase